MKAKHVVAGLAVAAVVVLAGCGGTNDWTGTSTALSIGEIEEALPPHVIAWHLVAEHGGAEVRTPIPGGFIHGFCCGSHVEPREARIVALIATISEPMDADSLGLPFGDDSWPPVWCPGRGDLGAIIRHDLAELDATATEWRLPINGPLPDGERYAVFAPDSLLSLGCEHLTGDRGVIVRVLTGDANANRTVDVGDLLAVKAHEGALLTADNARYDIDGDGTIGEADMRAVRGYIGHSMRYSCAPPVIAPLGG